MAVRLDSGWIRHGRAQLNLAMRVSTRAFQVGSARGAGRGPLRMAAAVASGATDAVLARRLSHTSEPDLLRHWLIDAADLAAWTALATDPGDGQLAAAITPAHPLAIEVGARHGALAGLAVPVANAAVTATVSRLRRQPHATPVYAWQVAAAVGGAALSRYARSIRARRLAAHEARSAPELERRELAARNEEALALGNILDEVQRAAALIRLGADVDVDTGAVWKAELAERTRRSHRYLVDALLGWQRRHNQTPDLSRVVDLRVGPDLAAVVLSAEAAFELERRLDQLDLRGTKAVALRPAADHDGDNGDDGVVRFSVGGHPIDLATGVGRIHLVFDPLPGAFGWMALWLLAAAPQDGVPLPAALGPTGAALGLMGWAHRASRDGLPVPPGTAVAASTLLTVVAASLQTATMTVTHDHTGLPHVPASLALRGHAFVTALARPLTRQQLAMATVGGAVAVVLAWALTPRPRSMRELLAELSWVGMSATMARAFTDGIERDTADLDAWVAERDRQRLESGDRAGREAVRDTARTLIVNAERLYAEYGDRLDATLQAEVRRRLDDCTARLASG